jgi:O-antigen ligase
LLSVSNAARSLKQSSVRPLLPSLVLLSALMASIPLENSAVLPSIGSIARLLGLIATGAVLIDSAIILGFRRGHVAHLPLALFVLWSAWTYVWSVNPQLTSERITTNLQLMALVWVIWQSVRELRDLRMVLQGFVLGSCCAAVLTVINWRELAAYDGIRYSGAGADPNELGLMMVISLLMAYYLSKTAPTSVSRILWLVPLPLCILGIILTVSRAAFITTTVALVGISIWHVATTSSRMRFPPLIAGVLLLAVGMAFVPKANLERIETIQSEISGGRIGKRVRIWKAGMELFEQHPMTGMGAATFAYAVEPLIGRDLAAHNTYISVLTETGIIGFICFAFTLITFATLVMRLNSAERSLWLLVMLVWCIAVMSLTFEYKKATWAIFGLLIATAGASEMPLVGPLTSRVRATAQMSVIRI